MRTMRALGRRGLGSLVLGGVLGAVLVGAMSEPGLASAPPNDACAAATTLVRGVAVAASNADTVTDGAESTCGFNDTKDVWFTFHSTEFANYRVQTDPSSALDTTISVYTGCGGTLLGCNDDSPDVGRGEHWSRVDFNMSPNQTVKIRVAGWAGATGTFVLKLDYVPVFHPANDDCAAAVPLTLGEPLNTTTTGCTGTDLSSCGEEDALDAWYSFVAPRDGTFDFTPTNTDIFGLFFSAYPTCGGPEITCGLRAISVPMTAGQSIVVRAAFIGGVAGTFTMNIGPSTPVIVPANDDCSGAIPILGTGTTAGTTRGATGFDTGNIFGCTLNDTGPGVWYQFVAPDAGIYSFDTNGSPGMDDTALVLFDTCTSFGGTGLSGCDDNLGEGLHSRVLWLAEQAGQSVYIVVAGQHHSAGDFLLNVTTDLQAAPNDRCFLATPIPPSGVITGDNYFSRDIDVYGSVCDEGRYAVFYSYVAPADATYLFDVLNSPDLPYSGVAIYDTCGGNELACGPDRAVRLTMRAGDSVIVRVSGSMFYRGAFMLRVRTDEPGPANDRCDAAAPIAFGTSVHATNRGATGSITTNDCTSTEATDPADVWYSFVPPASGDYTFSATGFIFPGLSVFSGCWPEVNAIACADGCQSPAAITMTLSAGEGVNVRVRPCFLGYGGRKEFGAFTLAVGSSTLGACCSGATCRLDIASGCAGTVDHFNGAGTACTAAGTGTPCCRADFNHRDGLSVQDIFDYLNAWFAGSATADINGGGLSVQDIFDYLNAWFAGC